MERIGRYGLTRRLGAGSFATVWQGRDEELDVDVAVKVLADNWSANDDVRGRFLAEARLMRRIRDHRIVRVYDIGTLPDGRPYFVMDLATGGSLEDLRRRRVGPTLALHLSSEAARCLHVLHEHDVIHRDVTPGNLLLDGDPLAGGHVVLADLGVAKEMVVDKGSTMTAGTPAHMALEQATGHGILDRRADVYSLASVCFTLITGEPPYPVRTLADLLSRDPHAAPPPVAASIGAPPELDHLLAAALSPVPGRRPPTAAVLADELDGIVARMGGVRLAPPQPAPDDATVLRPSGPGWSVPSPGSAPPQPQRPGAVPLYTPTSIPPRQPAPGPAYRQSTPPTLTTPTVPTPPAPRPRRSPAFALFVTVVSLLTFVLALSVTVIALG
ncbi:serine/threonine-protein kinase [Auraticoccus monumenti]|uniref:non-specific serine/threonine protein kinase n=1 Tax=Auraticoccus monumenti TaxID=675864 RepID=A0A1G6ZC23_9ACTN|nr:serine/threonine-protein kinase [Auraticoccus monumenti]SDD99843.1 Serine/threonine protein kinase [Auraticoccus monumenti]